MSFVPYLHYIFNGLFILATYLWGDWRNWRIYYPTILFYITGDLVYNYFTINYSLWTYNGLPSSRLLKPLLIMGVAYPCTILIYLKYALRGWKEWVFQYILWVVLYILIEVILYKTKLIVYHHGWTFFSSVLVDFAMFFIFIVHHKRPIMGWALYISILVFIVLKYHIPVM